VRISIGILKTTSVVVVRRRNYVERWRRWLNQICDGSGERTRSLSWQGRKVLSTTKNFWVIPEQHEVYRVTWRWDRFQPTTDVISG